ncbi:glycosyltransferase family 4 protein [Niallia sp. NCCP-28]|uniref:glycosyltransferase family 4 protein n=1 Tax=Niallia sp. NCCP-28 TaxID=2934712 RepID=UPI002087D90E|nr:glycosyltransferase family 4 protein [Niallia sp. NCCP-28]GKU84894.1 glycosyl transferase [Niallia sp. NCCP-28]
MKIAFVCNEVKPVPSVEGGAVETLVDLLIANNEKDKKVHIDVYSKYNEKAKLKSKSISNTNFYFVKSNSKVDKIYNIFNMFFRKLKIKKYFSSYLFNLVGILSKNEYDWIIVENRPLYIKEIVKNSKRAKIALHLHNDTVSRENYYSKYVIQKYDKILCVSNYIYNRVVEVNEKNKDKAVVLENRIDVNQFQKNEDNIYYLRKKYNISSNETILLYHGRVIEEKGVLELVAAFNKALTENSLLRLCILGNVTQDSYGEKINNIIQQLPVDKVIMMGYVEYEELPKYLQGADIIVLPSLWHEPFGLTIVESMAMSKPVISTAVGAIPEILSNNCGILIKKNNEIIDNLALEILALVKSREKQQLLSENARRKVVDLYNAEKYLEDLINKLDK